VDDNPLERMNWELKVNEIKDNLIRFTVGNDTYQTSGIAHDNKIRVSTVFLVRLSKYISYSSLGQNQNNFERFLEKIYPELLL